MCSITTQKIMIDKIKHKNHKGRQHMTKYWSDSLSPQWIHQAVIMVSRSTLDDHKNKNGVVIDLFRTGVIGHPRYMFLN